MRYCKDCKFWKPDYSKVSNQGNVMYGNCTHPDCKRDGLFRDHRQCRDGSNRMDWIARHSDDRYRTHPACKNRFVEKVI